MPRTDASTEQHAEKLLDWLEGLKRRDNAVFADVAPELARVTPELAVASAADAADATRAAGGAASSFELESIILRTGRPVLPIRGNEISTEGAYIESDSIEIVKRLKDAQPKFKDFIPSVGRIDVANSMFAIDWLGTGWLIEPDVVVTNRHVAEQVAGQSGGRFVFRPGRNGTSLGLSIDFMHEMDAAGEAAFTIDRVIWIETDPRGPDIAFLGLRETPGNGRVPVPLAKSDGQPDMPVAIIGYPARAPQRTIPEQDLMERIFNGRYDVKRIAPGLLGRPDPDNWSTHDCTTLGGNSGSVTLDIKTGEAVALHFAGAFMIENYAVPASRIHRYLRERPWQGMGLAKPADSSLAPRPSREDPATVTVAPPAGPAATAGVAGSVSITIPLHISITIGEPSVVSGKPGEPAGRSVARPSISDAVAAARRQYGRLPGVVAVRHGYVFDDGEITKDRCVVFAVQGEAVDAVRSRVEDPIQGWPIDVRPAAPDDLMQAVLGNELLALERAGGDIAYDDDARTAAEFALEAVEVEADALCHVGPERSWAELSTFLAGATSTLDCAMYEFNAKHVADELQKAMENDVQVRLTLDSLLAGRNENDPELFGQRQTFDRWSGAFGDGFAYQYVPEGARGLIWNAYHIKVAVRDGEAVWLSSGNWKPSSQPNLTGRTIGAVDALPGNREWHIILKEKAPHPITRCFQAHIQADARFSAAQAGEEARSAQIWVDVPMIELEAMALEAPVSRPLLPSQSFSGPMRIQPLLTPDRRGAAFCRPVLSLIRSAREQLWFQIPYITPNPETAPKLLVQLVSALVDASKRVDDFRLILRSDTYGSLQRSLEALQDAGLDVASKVRQRPSSHTKGMVVDGRHTLIGSHNWSGAGVTINRDASLIIYDNPGVADYYGEAFRIDWDHAAKPRLPSGQPQPEVVPAAGERPPAGYVRMPLEAFFDL